MKCTSAKLQQRSHNDFNMAFKGGNIQLDIAEHVRKSHLSVLILGNCVLTFDMLSRLGGL